MSSRKRPGILVLLALLCLVAGCYEKTTRADESVYHFAWWLRAVVIAAGLLMLPAGWLLRRRNQGLGVILMILAPVLLVIVGPAMFNDRVVIDAEHFEARYGFWFSPSEHNVRFDDLREIRYVAVRGARNRIKYEVQCVRKDGGTTVVHAGDLVRNAVPEILSRAKAKKVPVLTQEP